MRRMIGTLLATFVLSACSDFSATTNTLPGTYTLRLMNGSPLPYSMQMENGVERRYTSGQLLLREDDTYRLSLVYTDILASDSTPGQRVLEGIYMRTYDLNFQLKRINDYPYLGHQVDRSTVRLTGDFASWEYEFTK